MGPMTKTHVRHSIAALLVLGFAAAGCAVDTDESAAVGEKVAVPSQEAFDYAPEGEQIEFVKEKPDLSAKGSITVPYAPAHTEAVTIGPFQTVTFSTSAGSAGVDPVLVLFKRHDNSTAFGTSPFQQQVGTVVLAVNDDFAAPDRNSRITYTNPQNNTLNARLMVFAWISSTGTTTLTGPTSATVKSVGVVAGGYTLAPSASGQAWTSGTTGGGDPWLFTFGTSPGNPQGDGNWQDDSPNGGLDSLISGNPNKSLWYVASGWNSGTTTINN